VFLDYKGEFNNVSFEAAIQGMANKNLYISIHYLFNQDTTSDISIVSWSCGNIFVNEDISAYRLKIVPKIVLPQLNLMNF
jgi:hypothetical protein